MQNSETQSGQQPGQSDGAATGGEEQAGRSAFAEALARELDADDDSRESGRESGPGDGGEKPKTKPKDLHALAERLGVEVSELYNIAVPAGHGREPMTLGKLKDRYSEWATLEADRLAHSEERVQKEAELTRARQELQELMSVIPREQLLNREVLQRVAARVAARNKAQEEQVVQSIPEWRDETVRTAERTDITKMLEGYGLTAPEVTAIRDPRLVKFLRDAVRREKQVRKALESVRPANRKPAGQQPATRGAPNRRQDATPTLTPRPSTARDRFLQAINPEN